MTISNERKQEILRRLTPEQRVRLLEYDQRHKELLAQPDKLRQWENVLMMFEEFFEVLKYANVPIEPQIESIVEGWKEHIHIDDRLAKDLEKTLRQIAALVEAS